MQSVVVFDNSGSGKSTLAKNYAVMYGSAHLDLDALAWQDTNPPTRRPLNDSATKIEKFLEENQNRLVEGCYSDVLSLVIEKANEFIFLNPGVETCINSCRYRPWEPHKYKSKKEQNRNVDMLLGVLNNIQIEMTNYH